MKIKQEITLRAFPVKVEDTRTGEIKEDRIVLTKEQLRAADVVGQSSKELITRLYNREGYRVLEIGKAAKRTVCIKMDTATLWEYPEADGGAFNSSPED